MSLFIQIVPKKWLQLLLPVMLITSSFGAISQEKYDIAIIGGRVIDPESGLDAKRNIGILGNKIAIVTDQEIVASKLIDAQGMVVSPGFIDLHAHGQSILSGRMQALDGVTTALELEAGVLPVSEFYDVRAKEGRPINYGASVNWASARIATILNVIPKNDPEWFEKIFSETSWRNSIATQRQLLGIKKKISEGLKEGAIGIGFLSGYAPNTGYKEYYEISKLAAKQGVPTFTHARFLSVLEPKSSFEGIEEIIAVAASTGVNAHIVHLNSISLRDIDIISELILGAQSNGVSLTTEAYPYAAGATGIGAAMFTEDKWRERIGGITAHNFEIDGKRLSEEEFERLQTQEPDSGVIIHFLDLEKAEDRKILDRAVLLKNGAIASDGGDWILDGKIVEQSTWPIPNKAWSHPRSAGTFSRFLKLYVREKQSLSLLEAIEKTSLIPAKILQDSVPQMKLKGRIQVGFDADIVVFDLAKVSDQATYSVSAKISTGFKFVIVNGVLLVENEILNTSVLPGKAVRRPLTK